MKPFSKRWRKARRKFGRQLHFQSWPGSRGHTISTGKLYGAWLQATRDDEYCVPGYFGLFRPHLRELMVEIRRYLRHQRPGVPHKHARYYTLTEVAWSLGGDIYNRGFRSHPRHGKGVGGLRLLDFSERNQRVYLRNGLIELCKLLCREIEALP